MNLNKQMLVVVTGGSAYTDIDVLACVAAYKQLLRLQDHRAFGVTHQPWNQTIPPLVQEWDIDVEGSHFEIVEEYQSVLVDFSDPKYASVDIDSVVEVFDHHHGYEAYWKEKIGANSRIESVGACATLIWEQFVNANLEAKISPINANLLFTAIFSNTLDFKSSVTTQRDIQAANQILVYAQLSAAAFKEDYYAQVESQCLLSLERSIYQDMKKINFDGTEIYFGQIELAYARRVLERFSFSDLGARWIINIVSIQENCSYILSNCTILTQYLSHITLAKSNSESVKTYNLLITSQLWLRKELLKRMMLLRG